MRGLGTFENANQRDNATLLLFLLTATAYLLRWADQEPRHIFKGIGTLFPPRAQRDQLVIQAETHPLGLW